MNPKARLLFTNHHTYFLAVSSVRKNFLRGLKYESVILKDTEFRVLVIPGHTKLPEDKKLERRPRDPPPPPRCNSMPVDQNWTDVWPASKPVTWSTLPMPVRMGYVEKSENNGMVPSKYANLELMKIPNFLHLTPEHIRKQCAAIKKFCTAWPEGLKAENISSNFPVEITTSDYVFDGPSLKDERAREVKLTVKLSALKLDYHARDKFIRLAGKAYNKSEDVLTLRSDRCPLKQQNYDYLIYLLTALYKESCKTETWESEKTLQDMEKYFWEINASRKNVVDVVKKIKSVSQELPEVTENAKIVKKLPENPSDEDVLNLKEVKDYKKVVEKLLNGNETLSTVKSYKATVKNLLGLK